MIVSELRASAILYNLLTSHPHGGGYLLPANVCPVVPAVFMKAGVPFEFVDISPRTLCMDLDRALERWKAKSTSFAGLLFVRTYGNVDELGWFFRELKRCNADALTIDDRCLCFPEQIGTNEDGVDVRLFSTGYAKPLDLGFGGLACLDDGVAYTRSSLPFDDVASKRLARSLKATGECGAPLDGWAEHWLDTRPLEVSLDEYLERIVAAIASTKEHKRQLNDVYVTQLPFALRLAGADQSWRFNIMVENKADVLSAVFDAGFFASGHYANLAGIVGPGGGAVAEQLHRHVVNLFNDYNFDVGRADRLSRLLCNVARPRKSQSLAVAASSVN